jgi:hypothetical protein
MPWTTFVNYDRYWGLELDFPPTLDEFFSITTSKQQIVIQDNVWDILKDNGVLFSYRRDAFHDQQSVEGK